MDQQPTPERLEIERLRERVRLLEARLAEQEQLRPLLRHSRDSLVILNADQSQRYVSPGAGSITGFAIDELQGRSLAELIHPDDLPAVAAAWDGAVADPDRAVTVCYRHIHKTEGWVHSEAIAQSFLGDPMINGVIASVRDISDHVRTERESRRFEHALQAVFNATTESIYLICADGTVLMANEAAARRLGTTAEQLVGRVLYDLFPPDVAARRRHFVEQAVAAGQPRTLVDRRQGRSYETTIWPVVEENGGRSRIAVFSRDVTEQVRAEQALKRSQALLDATQALAKVGGWEWDLDSRTMTWTAETYRLHGLTPEDRPADTAALIEISLACYRPEDQQKIAAAFQACVESGQPYDLRFPFRTVDGRDLWIRTMAEPIRQDGRIVLVRGSIADITEQVMHEDHLCLFRNIVASTEEGITYVDHDYRYVLVNEAYQQLSGFDREQFVGRTVAEYLGAQIFAEVIKPRLDLALQGEAIHYQHWFEYPVVGRRFVDVRYYPCWDKDQRIIGVITSTRDLTDRRQTEEALQASEERFQTIVEACPLPILIISGGRYRYANTFARRMLGWSDATDCTAFTLEQTIDPRSHGQIRARLAASQTGRANPPMELMLLRADGRRMMVESRSLPIQLADGPATLIIGTDITARKKREALLRARLRISEAASAGTMDDLLRRILDEAEMLTESRIGFFHCVGEDQRTVSLQTWSTSTVAHFCQADGRGQHEAVDQAGVWADCIRERQPVIHNDYPALPHRRGLPEGHAAVQRQLVLPIFRSDRIVAVFGVGNKEAAYDQDDVELVTSLGELAWDFVLRKQAEEQLRESESRYSRIVETAREGIWAIDEERRTTFVNSHMAAMLGHTDEEMMGRVIDEFIFAEDLAEHSLRLDPQKQGIGGQYELRFVHRDGSEVWVMASGMPLMDQAGRFRGSFGMFTDITRRKAAETSLQAQADFTRRILDSTAAHLAILDPWGVIVDVNTPWRQFAEENGGTVVERLGPGASYFCAWSAEHGDATHAEEAYAGIRRVQRGEQESFAIEYPCHAPGTERWFSLRVLPLKGNQGFVLVSHTDISTLKSAEQRLTRALAEKEVLLREVHHRVKNNLASILGLLDMQCRTLRTTEGLETLKILASRIRSMGLIHEKLYCADDLSRIDFQAYVQALISHLRTSFASPRILCQVEAERMYMPLDLAMPCGMIINELVTNAMKYAFPQGEPAPGQDDCRILVRITIEDDAYILCVADNGAGLPSGFDWSRANTMGLTLVHMIGCHQLGGSYALDQEGGLKVTLRFSEKRGS